MIFGPICHVGCFSASAAVTFASALSDRPRNGPPEAVRISRRSSPLGAAVQALMDRVVLAVDGQHRDALLARRVHHEAAGHHQHFLVGQRDGLARLDRAEHGVERRGAGRRAQDDVDVGMRGDLAKPLVADAGDLRRRSAERGDAACPSPRRWPSPRRAGGTRGSASPSPPTLVAAAIATTSTRSRCVRATSSALVPIDPVEPRMAMRFTRVPSVPKVPEVPKASFYRCSNWFERHIWNRGRTMPLELVGTPGTSGTLAFKRSARKK